jgi:two-component system cell cycle sensor histidine kinase/response regulator CckA
MKSPLHILHLEDDPNDAALIQSTLEAGGIICATTCVQSHDDFVAALEHGGIDLILSDFSLPAFDGLSALEIVRTKWPAIPLILVSGTLGEERAIDSLKRGATDYVLKERLARLVPAVHRAMQEVEERTERRRLEQGMVLQATALKTAANGIMITDPQGNILWVNPAFTTLTGYTAEEVIGKNPRLLKSDKQDQALYENLWKTILSGQTWRGEFINRRKNGSFYFDEQTITPVRPDDGGVTHFIGIMNDVSDRKRLEAEFIEAQKMEVIGQLAGGVAHDFNNILAVIMGYSDLIMSDLGPDSPLRKYAEEIQHASERAAGLTRQLLVFSRKQTVQPVVLDLNDVVKDMDKMLRRLIGGNIEMTMIPGKQIGRIKADSGYVGQVLMNLVVNARDAMPNGGRLTIATGNVTLDENYSLCGVGVCASPGGAPLLTPQGKRTHPGAIPGDYVMLSVSDTGTGVTDEVKAHLFEPFFTTKPSGKGTGLGLATCQTIVQQSGGHIGIYSEVGKGTTFKIYFPRVEQPLEVAARLIQAGPLPRGTETLLVVEDEPAVRHLACGVLEAQGYTVLCASNGQDGLRAVHEHKGSPIRLVVTDVIMPLMGGKVMTEWLKTTHPGLKILFTSGYTDDAITHHGVLEPRVAFLPKPYTPGILARKVRAMLDNETDTTYLWKQGVTINQSPPGST